MHQSIRHSAVITWILHYCKIITYYFKYIKCDFYTQRDAKTGREPEYDKGKCITHITDERKFFEDNAVE